MSNTPDEVIREKWLRDFEQQKQEEAEAAKAKEAKQEKQGK